MTRDGEARSPLPDYPDFESEGLLDGLEGDDREARRQLLEYLVDSGISLRDIKSEARAERLALVPADLKLGLRRRTLTPIEISQETGLSVEDFQKLIAALGFPKPEPGQMTFGEEDLAAAKRMKKFQEAGISTEGILALTRQVGSGTARIAQAYRDLVASDLVDPGSNEFEVAMTLRDAAEELFPLGEQALSYALRSHFVDQIRGDVIEAAEPGWMARADAVEVSVCFADLVGFTRLGERSELERIGSVTALLESVAIEVTNPEVRLVKLVGDAAMMVSEDGGAIFDAALRFIEVGEEAGEDLPALRVGVARGQAIQQVGDWFGHPVNLASRITETARPGSVLAEATAVEAGGDRFSYSTAGRHKFKGMSKPVELFRVRRKPEDLSEPEWLP